MGNFWQDLLYGFRLLRKNAGFTAVAVLALALGIGANTAIFSVVNALLLNPLPYKEPDRITLLWERNPRLHVGFDDLPISAGDFEAWREQNHVFAAISALSTANYNLTGEGQPQKIGGASVSSGFFDVMGIQPEMGRTFSATEDRLGAERVAIISHGLWQRQFGADSNLIGKPLKLNDQNYTIIGIMPAGFAYPELNDLPVYSSAGAARTDIWTPVGIGPEQIGEHANRNLAVIARLKPDITLGQAQAEMGTISLRLDQQFKSTEEGFSVRLIPLKEQIFGHVRPALVVMLGAVAFVLLIACANLANLLLARSLTRQREIAIRTALGASRGSIIRQLLTESVLLAAIGGAAGGLLSIWGIKTLVSLAPITIPRLEAVRIDGHVFGFMLGVSLITGILFGLLPAVQTSSINLVDSFKGGSAGAAGSMQGKFVRNGLVVAESALSLMLLIGAGLLINSFVRLLRVDTGFDQKNVLTMRLQEPDKKLSPPGQARNFFQQVIQGVQTLPGVEAVGVVSQLPLSGGVYAGGFTIENQDALPDSVDPTADRRMVSAGYLNAMRVPLISGRQFTEYDNESAPGVAIVNRAFTRRFIPGGDVIGRRVKLGGANSTRPWLSIIGIADDVRDAKIQAEATPAIYVPYQQFSTSSMTLVVRSVREPQSLTSAVQSQIWALDKDSPITDVKTMDKYVAAALAPQRFNVFLLGVFAAIALVLAAVGIYGVVTYSVSQRTREIGIRMAMGAMSNEVLRLVLIDGLRPVVLGLGLGLIGALGLTRLLTSLLYGVTATDATTFVIVSLCLVAASLLACYFPARRATKVNPMIVLRYE